MSRHFAYCVWKKPDVYFVRARERGINKADGNEPASVLVEELQSQGTHEWEFIWNCCDIRRSLPCIALPWASARHEIQSFHVEFSRSWYFHPWFDNDSLADGLVLPCNLFPCRLLAGELAERLLTATAWARGFSLRAQTDFPSRFTPPENIFRHVYFYLEFCCEKQFVSSCCVRLCQHIWKLTGHCWLACQKLADVFHQSPTPLPRTIILSLALSLPSAASTKWRPWTLFGRIDWDRQLRS